MLTATNRGQYSLAIERCWQPITSWSSSTSRTPLINSWAKSKPQHATCWISSTPNSPSMCPSAPPRCVASASFAGPAFRRMVSPSVGGRHLPIHPTSSTFIRAIDPKSKKPSMKQCAMPATIGWSNCQTASSMPGVRGAHRAATKWRWRARVSSFKTLRYSPSWMASRIPSISSISKRRASPCRTWRA